ncbi:MAG: YadA-like family protein [Rhizobiaceae bacterium]
MRNNRSKVAGHLRLLAATSVLASLPFAQANAFSAGGGNDGGDTTYNVSIGSWSETTGSTWATAVGAGSKVLSGSDQGTAIGFDALVESNSRESTAVGTRSSVRTNSAYSTAIGNHAEIKSGSQQSTALGQAASVGENSAGSVALGHQAKVLDDVAQGTAVGQYSEARHANSVALGAGSVTVTGAETYTGYGLTGTQESVGSVGVGTETGDRTITGVAAGHRDNDAVNVEQLRTVDERLSDEIDTLDSFAVKYDPLAGDPSQPDYRSITLGVGPVGNAPVLINNVAAGDISSTSYEAVNGAQIHAISSRIADAFGGGSTVNPDGTISAPVYNIQGGSYTNVGSAFARVDDELSALHGDVKAARTEARQAAAVGLAASSLRYDDRPGKFSVAASGAVWQSEGAFAFGAGYTSEDQRVRANLNAATSGGDWGVGGGLSFTLN